MSKIGIVTALPDEAMAIFADPLQPQIPQLITSDIFLCLSGVGYNNALNAAAALIKHGVDALVSWGVAGAINEALRAGDLLIAKQVRSVDGEFNCSRAWQERLLAELNSGTFRVFNATLYSVASVCTTPRDKRELYEQTGAAAVDMESSAIAELAQKMDIEFIAIRAIADESIMTIPPAVTRHTDKLGRPMALRFAVSCLLKPSQLISILMLARAYKKALENLQSIATGLKKQHFLYNVPS